VRGSLILDLLHQERGSERLLATGGIDQQGLIAFSQNRWDGQGKRFTSKVSWMLHAITARSTVATVRDLDLDLASDQPRQTSKKADRLTDPYHSRPSRPSSQYAWSPPRALRLSLSLFLVLTINMDTTSRVVQSGAGSI
jgi:hypothetical protein